MYKKYSIFLDTLSQTKQSFAIHNYFTVILKLDINNFFCKIVSSKVSIAANPPESLELSTANRLIAVRY